jgi:hypothetical protein
MWSLPPIDRGNGGFTWRIRRVPGRHQRAFAAFGGLEALTVPGFLETVAGIVMGGVDVYRVSQFLQSEGSIDDEALGTAWKDKDVSEIRVGMIRGGNAPIPRSGWRNAMRNGGWDMKHGETWFPRSLVIVPRRRSG